MANLCPICGKDDAVQKVSAIVQSGTVSGSYSGPTGGMVNVDGKWGYSGGYTTLHGQSKTALAGRFSALPQKPKEGGNPNGWIWLLALFSLGVGGGGTFGTVIAISVCIVGFFPNLDDVTKNSYLGVGIALAFLASIAVAVGVIILFSKLTYDPPTEQARRKTQYQNRLQKWNQALDKVNRARYCFRDDVVFDPETGEYCSSDQFQKFLNYPVN